MLTYFACFAKNYKITNFMERCGNWNIQFMDNGHYQTDHRKSLFD